MPNIKALSCCGIGEIAGIAYDPQDFVGKMRELLLPNTIYGYETLQNTERRQMRRGCYVFTSNTMIPEHYGAQFAANIEKNKLGKVRRLPHFTNPNTNRPITMYLWYPDYKALVSFRKKHHIY